MTREKLQIVDWITALAPSKELLDDRKGGCITWPEYETRYTHEMSSQSEVIDRLATIAEVETITLLCYEKECDPHCHRYLLKEMIENRLKKSRERPRA